LGSRGDSGDRNQWRRRVGVGESGGVFAHVGDTLDCPAAMALEAFDLAPQIRIEREKGFVVVVVLRGVKQRVRTFECERFVRWKRQRRRGWRGRHCRRSPSSSSLEDRFLFKGDSWKRFASSVLHCIPQKDKT